MSSGRIFNTSDSRGASQDRRFRLPFVRAYFMQAVPLNTLRTVPSDDASHQPLCEMTPRLPADIRSWKLTY